MRYTHAALLLFGAGLLAGLVIVAFDLGPLQRIASGLMAAGIAALPVAMLVDWRRATRAPAKRGKTARKPQQRRAATPRRRGKAKPVASKKSP